MKKLIYLVLLLSLFSCNRADVMHEYSGEVQGTFFTIKYYDNQMKCLNVQIDSILDDFDFLASVYNDSSVLSRINRNEKVDLPPDFITLFNRSLDFYKLSDGYFDVTVAPLVGIWGFYKKQSSEPDSAEIDSIMQYVGCDKIRLENGEIIKDYPEIKMDFNAIAQGYSVDLICNYFESRGIENYLVEIGGEVRASGAKPNGNKWIVGVEEPAKTADAPQKIMKKLAVENFSVATSGSSRKFYEKNGVKYSHTINPKSGYPVSHSLLSVTVIAKSCADADAWATSFMVMGIDEAKEVLKSNSEISAFFIFSDSTGNFQTLCENGFEKYFVE